MSRVKLHAAWQGLASLPRAPYRQRNRLPQNRFLPRLIARSGGFQGPLNILPRLRIGTESTRQKMLFRYRKEHSARFPPLGDEDLFPSSTRRSTSPVRLFSSFALIDFMKSSYFAVEVGTFEYYVKKGAPLQSLLRRPTSRATASLHNGPPRSHGAHAPFRRRLLVPPPCAAESGAAPASATPWSHCLAALAAPAAPLAMSFPHCSSLAAPNSPGDSHGVVLPLVRSVSRPRRLLALPRQWLQ